MDDRVNVRINYGTLSENIGENVHDLELSKAFLDPAPKTQHTMTLNFVTRLFCTPEQNTTV